MKNIIKSIVVILIITMTPESVLAQGNNTTTADFLIGTWSLDFNKSISRVTTESKTYYNGLENDNKARIKNSFSKRKISFMSDGTYILEVREGKTLTGNWELNNDKETLNISMDNGKQLTQRVESINSSTMCLNLGGNQSARRLFNKWYLIKISQ